MPSDEEIRKAIREQELRDKRMEKDIRKMIEMHDKEEEEKKKQGKRGE